MSAASLVDPGTWEHAEPPWRREQRLAAVDWLSGHADRRPDETWRYTPIESILDQHRGLPADHGHRLVPGGADLVRSVVGADPQGPVLVFVDGRYDPRLSRSRPGDDGRIGPASARGPELVVPAPLEIARPDAFLAWNQAAAVDAVVVSVDAEAATAGPVNIVHLRSTAADPSHPRTVVDLAEGATVTVVETFLGGGPDTLTNAATTVRARPGSTVHYHRLQDEHPRATHVGHLDLDIGDHAAATVTLLGFGAATARLTTDALLDGTGASVDLAGLYLPRGDQRHDHMVTIEHRGSRCRSTQHFRGIIDDRARGAFTGHVLVAPGSGRTDAQQVNRNLLLSPTARAISQPWLEIFNDDVSCDHGATVGRLDAEALFFLRSRGIPEQEAHAMLIDAFAGVIVDAIGPDALRDHVAALVARRRRSVTRP